MPELTTQSDESIAVATIDEPLFTCPASAIVDDGLDSHTIANMMSGHTIADLFNDTAELVAKCKRHRFTGYGMRGGGAQIRPSEILVQI